MDYGDYRHRTQNETPISLLATCPPRVADAEQRLLQNPFLTAYNLCDSYNCQQCPARFASPAEVPILSQLYSKPNDRVAACATFMRHVNRILSPHQSAALRLQGLSRYALANHLPAKKFLVLYTWAFSNLCGFLAPNPTHQSWAYKNTRIKPLAHYSVHGHARTLKQPLYTTSSVGTSQRCEVHKSTIQKIQGRQSSRAIGPVASYF